MEVVMNVSMWSQYLGGVPIDEMPAAFAEHGFKTLELSDEQARELLESAEIPKKRDPNIADYCVDSRKNPEKLKFLSINSFR